MNFIGISGVRKKGNSEKKLKNYNVNIYSDVTKLIFIRELVWWWVQELIGKLKIRNCLS